MVSSSLRNVRAALTRYVNEVSTNLWRAKQQRLDESQLSTKYDDLVYAAAHAYALHVDIPEVLRTDLPDHMAHIMCNVEPSSTSDNDIPESMRPYFQRDDVTGRLHHTRVLADRFNNR